VSIYQSRYERYDGPIEPASTRFLVIAETELRRLYKEKWVRRLFLMAWAPVLFLAARLYLQLVVGEALGDDSTPDDVFLMLFKAEAWFVAIMLAAFGSSMIARDVTNRSLTLYFTRPLDVDQYLWGKLLGVLITVLGVTFVPAMLLAVAQLLMSKEAAFGHFLDMSWRIAAASLVAGSLVSTLILLLSSLGRSPRYVGVAWLGIFVFLTIARGVLVKVLGPYELLDLISIQHLFVQTGECVLMGDSEQLSALIASVLLSGFFYVALRVRLQSLERAQT